MRSALPVKRLNTFQIDSEGQSASSGYVLHSPDAARLDAASSSSPNWNRAMSESSRLARFARTSSVSWKASGSEVSSTSSPAGLTVDSSAAAV
ncbi:hypothetical protein IMZ48_11560 [Candidatus Bathyarchaeota archaeon]|nr:hypothetical protein [Candidatus Bathyarchaeota archaeon]